MKLYKTEVADATLTREGLGCWKTEGEAVDVDGVQMVRLPYNVIVPATDWWGSPEEATESAARVIEAHGLRLIEQAGRLRAGLQRSQEGGAA
ncbi:MAG: hypothetical protein RLZZ21_1380 [Planctomycetota bacterium]|jgi:hypothetical protein